MSTYLEKDEPIIPLSVEAKEGFSTKTTPDLQLTKEGIEFYNSIITDEQIDKAERLLGTGDILLTIGVNNKQERIVKKTTNSPITHNLLAIKLEGVVYLLESNSISPTTTKVTDYTYGTYKDGVRLIKFSDFYRHYNTVAFIRKVKPSLGTEYSEALFKFYKLHKHKPFERSLLQLYNAQQKIRVFNIPRTNEFFCSELVAEALQFIGLMKGPRNGGNASKFYTPDDFVAWQPDDKRYKYGPMVKIKG
jgi:hypothetical protein